MDMSCKENNKRSRGSELVPNVTWLIIAKFLRTPMFPPSGVSEGHIIP